VKGVFLKGGKGGLKIMGGRCACGVDVLLPPFKPGFGQTTAGEILGPRSYGAPIIVTQGDHQGEI